MSKLYKMRSTVTRMRTLKIKFIVLLFTVITTILFVVYIFMNIAFLHRNKFGPLSPVKLNNIVVHFDLKGSPPKLTYIKSLLPMLKNLGVTGFLMEYEDMFPYEGRLVNISASNCYRKTELKEFLTTAVNLGFEIIPLVQTFGHMEHVLKLAEFQHLREMPMFPDSICPSQAESRELIKDMLEQVIRFHDDTLPLKHFHIGCDEVYHINKCGKCRSNAETDLNIFFHHVEEVRSIVKKLSPQTVVLIWDDMLRDKKIAEWDKVELISDVEPVYWDYRARVELSHVSLLKYHQMFKEIWISSAFKGADGRLATLPNLKRRFLNHLSWLALIKDYQFGGEKEVFNFKGIILTGWSRYSHMDPPCELLPSSIPSLVLNLLLIQRFKEGVPNDFRMEYIDDFFASFLLEEFNNYLKCGRSVSVEYFQGHLCSFDGSGLYKVQRQNDLLNRNITIGFNDINQGLSAVEYYTDSNNLNVVLAQQSLAWCNETLADLFKLERQLAFYMSYYFERTFVNEYIGYKNYNAKKILFKLSNALMKSIEVNTWPRRPYNS